MKSKITSIDSLAGDLQHQIIRLMTFSRLRNKSSRITKARIIPYEKDGVIIYTLEYWEGAKAFHKHFEIKAIEVPLYEMLEYFKEINIETGHATYIVRANDIDSPYIKKSEKNMENSSVELFNIACRHNKEKNYLIKDAKFLIHVGIADKNGRIHDKAQKKYKQINRFVELAADAINSTKNYFEYKNSIYIQDFGSGKAYLTFALYHYLSETLGMNVAIDGLDIKPDVVEKSNLIAKHLGMKNMNFKCGDVRDFEPTHVDMVVTLHACDIATDYALSHAVRQGAEIILSVPCCQHELNRQLDSIENAGLLKYGILRDRLTESITDGIRALWLESKGYRTDFVEFTSLEHTAKNVCIRAVKNKDMSKQTKEKARKAIEEICNHWKIDPILLEL